MSATLPLDKESALRKMLKPHKQRRQEAVKCANPGCEIVRMVNAPARVSALCLKCSKATNPFNGGHGKR